MKTQSSKEYKGKVLDLLFSFNEGKTGLYETSKEIIKIIDELSSRIKRAEGYYIDACKRNNTLRSNVWFKDQVIKELKRKVL